jgi:hypothetical protein
MATKTWKLGEVCRGGVITVTTTKDTVLVQAKAWDMSAGVGKSSNQSKAKEWDRLEVKTLSVNADRDLTIYLEDLSTSYYAGKIMEWVKSKTKLVTEFNW